MTAPFRLGLTGSVGMGKSTTAAMFVEAGVPVWDADAAVHRLYAAGGAGAAVLVGLVPDAITPHGAVDRTRLRAAIAADPGLLAEIEARIHPLVAADRAAFAADHADAEVVLFDIPLLFETGGQREMDAVLVVTAPREVQRQRVLARPGMTADMLDRILLRQTPDAEKRALADYVIETHRGLDAARADVHDLLARIRKRHA